MTRLEKDLQSKIKVVPTYHIEKHPNSKNPELYLKKLLDEELKDSKVDYAIISVGTNDITDMDHESNDLTTLNNAACDQSKNLIHLVDHASQKYNIDIFVVERPPRNDSENMSMLTGSANGLYIRVGH